AVARTVMHGYSQQPVAVLCGPGNNGGDGLVAARPLHAAGGPGRGGLFGRPAALKGGAARACQARAGAGGPPAPAVLQGRPLIIDALFGAGLARPIAGVASEVIDRMNQDGLTVIAVDVPSGLHGDSGEVMRTAPIAAHTVTFFRAKPGHYSIEG